MSDEGIETQRRFELLMLDYEMTRDDERTAVSTQATGFGIAVALLAVMIPLLGQACDNGTCGPIPPWLIAAAPLAPLSMAGFLVGHGSIATIRSYYMRALEAELRMFAPRSLTVVEIPPVSFAGIATEVISLRRGRTSYRALVFLILFGTIVVFGGITAYLVWELPPLPRFVAIAVYLPVTLLIITEAARATLGGRGLFRAAAVSYVRGRVGLPDLVPQADFRERSLLGYLALPRPQDTIKWIFLPSSFAIGLWATDPQAFGRYGEALQQLWRSGSGQDRASYLWSALGPLATLATIFVILEYLVYQGRYQWNDIRGLGEDLDHPVAKGRLPVGFEREHLRRNVTVSQVIIFARQLAAILLALVMGHGLWVPTLALIIAVWGVAIPYELLRDRPLSGDPFRTTGLTLGIWTLVGTGYAVRGVTGLLIAGLPPWSPITLVAAIALVAFGVMFVTLTWVLDATSYFHGDPTRRRSDYQPALRQKPHLAALLRYVGARIGEPVAADPRTVRGRNARPLRPRGRILTPWNIALLVCCGFAGALGTGLALYRDERFDALPSGVSELTWSVAAAMLGAAAAWLLVLAGGPRRRWLAASGVVAVSLVLLFRPLETRGLLLILPWALFAFWFTWFRDQSFQALKEGLRPVGRVVRRSLGACAIWFVGRRTARLITQRR